MPFPLAFSLDETVRQQWLSCELNGFEEAKATLPSHLHHLQAYHTLNQANCGQVLVASEAALVYLSASASMSFFSEDYPVKAHEVRESLRQALASVTLTPDTTQQIALYL